MCAFCCFAFVILEMRKLWFCERAWWNYDEWYSCRAFPQNENGIFHYGIRKKAKEMFAWNTKFNFNEMENYVLFIYLLPLPLPLLCTSIVVLWVAWKKIKAGTPIFFYQLISPFVYLFCLQILPYLLSQLLYDKITRFQPLIFSTTKQN